MSARGDAAVPRYVLAYGVFLALFGVLVAASLAFNADAQFPGAADAVGGRFALLLLQARTLAFGVLLVAGLAWRHPVFLLAVFGFRFATDLLDVAFTLVVGFELDAAGDPLGLLFGTLSPLEPGLLNVGLYVAMVLAVFLLPMALSLAVLVRCVRRLP